MKNNIISLLFVGASLLSSCDVTDQIPVTLILEEDAFSDADKVRGNIIGVYDAAQRGWYLGAIQRGYPFGAASIQQGDMKSGDMYNDQLFYEITYINGWTPSTANNEGQWIAAYRLINRINVVIEGIEDALNNGIIDQETHDGYLSEMLFLRALSHHELLLHFSRPYNDNPTGNFGVPYREVAINTFDRVDQAEPIGRETVSASYEKIMRDLDQAEPLGGEIGPFRVSRGAIIALKLRVKLHMSDWAGVIEEFEKLNYELTPTPEVPFRNTETNTESIFSFNNTAESNPGVNGALAAMYGNPAEGGRGLVKISPLMWNNPFWLQGDARRNDLTTSFSGTGGGYYTSKYNGYINRDDPAPILRYAESVLSTAEAYARLGQFAPALELLNSIRNRAIPVGAEPYTLGEIQDDFLNVLWNEKRIEFLAEGIWWYDIHRLSGLGDLDGIPLKVASRSVSSIEQYAPDADLTLDHSLPYESNLFVWPIPLQEVVNNPVLADQQNPGY